MDVWLDATGGTKTVNNAVLMEIESLRRASMADLRKKYREVFEEATQCTHREHLFRRIAWRLQALAEGEDARAGERDRAGWRPANDCAT